LRRRRSRRNPCARRPCPPGRRWPYASRPDPSPFPPRSRRRRRAARARSRRPRAPGSAAGSWLLADRDARVPLVLLEVLQGQVARELVLPLACIDLDRLGAVPLVVVLGGDVVAGLAVLAPGLDLLPGDAVLLLDALVVRLRPVHPGQPVPHAALGLLDELVLGGVTHLVHRGERQVGGVEHVLVHPQLAAVIAPAP